MAQRISRAKQTIKESGIPFQMPNAQERGVHLRWVLHVLYLIFNEGYTATSGPHLRRADLSQEGIRLTRMALRLQPENAEIAGLLALMLLTDARRHARTGPNDELIPLAQQNRALWDREQIAEGVSLLSAALPKGSIGPYQLQAAIAAVHDEAERPEDTDWPQILALYELLKRMSDNPMVILNHAIAAAMVHGPKEGLDLLDALEGGPANCGTLPHGCGSRASAGNGWRLASSGEILPRVGGQNSESARAQLPSDASSAAGWMMARSLTSLYRLGLGAGG